MADVSKIIPKVLKWEGGFVNDKADPGGATNKGVTLEVWRKNGYDKDHDGDIDAEDLKLINNMDFEHVLKLNYWDRWRADYIKNQSIAEILVDWVWSSGAYGITIPQSVLGVTVDGQVGAATVGAINDYPNQEELHKKFYDARMNYIDRIVANSVNKYDMKMLADKGRHATDKELLTDTFKRFELGWKNRVNDSYKNFY
jgi:lysozyme family protein